MSITLTQILIQQGYLTDEHYQYAYQVQQSQPVEVRLPLTQIYLEQGFLGVEHITYCLNLRTQYIQSGTMPDLQELPTAEAYQQPVAEEQSQMLQCGTCLSEVQSNWATCPFCGSNVA